MWIEIILPKKNLLLSLIYRPPNSDQSVWLNHMENTLICAQAEDKEMIILGDTNIDLMKDSPLKSKWSDIIIASSLKV